MAIPFTFDTRSLGMGGVAVATATLGAAPWANPAMLAMRQMDEDFTVLIGAGALLRDDDDLIGDIDDFQDATNQYDDGVDSGNTQQQTAGLFNMRAAIRDAEGKTIAPQATAILAGGMALESFSMAISARTDIIAGGVLTNLSCELTSPGCNPNEILSDKYNILTIQGVQSTELGVSFAKNFEWFERKVAIGVKPKVVDLNSYNYSESIISADPGFDNLRDKENRDDLGTFYTVDLGFAMDLHDNWRWGLSLRNLVTDEFEIGNSTLNFDREVRFGVAYHNDWVTVGMDLDLTKNEPLLAGDEFEDLATQYIAIGSEFRLDKYVALRVGVEQNIASGVPDGAKDPDFTLGAGFWLGFNLDIAAVISSDQQSAGFMLQGGFSF